MNSASDPAFTVVVFSKDRPLQLDATLRSLELNMADGEAADAHVLYRASMPRYAAGYRILAGQHPQVALHPEVDFKADLVGLLTGTTHVLFLVDDTIFVAEFSLATAIDALDRDSSLVGFSFRLGRNTKYCYTLDKPQQLPMFDRQEAGTLSFDWTGAQHDFGYPLEVSSSLYRTADMLPIIERLAFRNPNTLEAALANEAGGFRATRPRLACYSHSVAVSVPANMVQMAWTNRVDGRAELAPEALLKRYEVGDRIVVEHYRGHLPNACHQELDYTFARDPAIPTISVVTRCYDQAQYLPEAVGSVVAQTFADWEIVVVDDGSPDNTAAVASRLIGEFGDRIRLVRQANAGLAGALNAGVAAARGRYILPLDADDMIQPTMLEQTVEVLEGDQRTAIAFTDMRQFGTSDRIIRAGVWDLDWLCKFNQLNYCSLYRREVWDTVGGYNDNMVLGYEDWDFWIACAEAGLKGQRIPQPLFLYRARPGTMASRALAHHDELVQQIRRNHPRQYTVLRRARRRLRTRPRYGPRWAVRRLLRGLGRR